MLIEKNNIFVFKISCIHYIKQHNILGDFVNITHNTRLVQIHFLYICMELKEHTLLYLHVIIVIDVIILYLCKHN